MIILTIALILFVCFIIPMIFRGINGDDLFSPTMIAFFFLIVTNVPYLVSMAIDHTLISQLVRWRIPDYELDISIGYYALVLCIGVLGLLLGLRSKVSNIIVKPIPVFIGNESKVRYFWAFVFAVLIGLMGYLKFIGDVGGFSVWIQNLQNRAAFTSGSGYLLTLLYLLNISVFIYICTFKYKRSLLKYLILIALVFGVAFIQTSLGGRKPTLQLIFFCFIVWHFGVSRIKQIPLKMLLVVPIALIYILVIPIFRSANGPEYYLNNPNYLISEVKENVGELTHELSYIDHYLLVLDHFSVDNIWLGKSFIDLFYAPIPSSLFPNKPPVDEGVYLRTIAAGQDVTPPTPFYLMYPSSLPPETFGTMYMNFWIPGVFVGMYLLGMIYNAAYLYMIKSKYNLYSILIYGNILLNFHISNLRITQTLTNIIIITLFLGIFFFGYKKKYRLVW